CLSGGGIRSASFAIGVMQGLSCLSVLTDFDYLSTVSGGGYAGSWLSAWLLHDEMRIKQTKCDSQPVGDQLAGACCDPLCPEPEHVRHAAHDRQRAADRRNDGVRHHGPPLRDPQSAG